MRPSSPAAIAALVLLTACDRAADAPPPAAPVAAPAPASSPAAPAPAWRLEASAVSGAALVHSDERGATVLRLACQRSPAGLHAELPGVARIDSEDRLTLGAGADLAVLVVSMEGPPDGLRAEGQPNPAFIAALADGRPLAAAYGAQQITLTAPPPKERTAFAAACAG